jgi:hypothetical protein
MKAARERPDPPACTAWSPSSVRAGAPKRPKDSTDIGTNGKAEDTCRYALRLEASRAAAANGRSAHSKGGSRRVDDGNVTHDKPAREHEHDIPPGPGAEGRGDTKRVQEVGWGPRARRGGRIGRQRRSSRRGQRRGVRDKHREASSAASRKGGERGSSRGKGGGRGRSGEEAEGGLSRGVDTRTSSDTAPTCLDKVEA